MTEIGDDHDIERVEGISADADVLKSAWTETIDEMKAMAAELEDEGWDVHHVAAGDTAPELPDVGPSDRWGLVYVVPDNFAEEFEAFVARGEYPRYDVHRSEVNGRVFHVTQLFDPDSSSALLIAGQFELGRAGGIVSRSKEAGTMYTHVQTLDGSVRGSFEHDEPSKFFPHYEAFDERYPDLV